MKPVVPPVVMEVGVEVLLSMERNLVVEIGLMEKDLEGGRSTHPHIPQNIKCLAVSLSTCRSLV